MVGRKPKVATVGNKEYRIFRSPWGWVVLEYTKGKLISNRVSKYYKSKSGVLKAFKRIVEEKRKARRRKRK